MEIKMDGLIFGLVDNGVLIFFAYIGLDLEGKISDLIGSKVRVGLGAILGGAFGNMISDGAGALLDPTMQMMFNGIVLGTLLPILAIPMIEKIRSARAN
mgnify:FL=1|tara:strand:- start:484 stop:780 length:297 start_codon:yes stop_codon:yes gene_type:complete